jgi:membrane-associated protease RseP (regulator of RpoE activity)
MKRGLFVSIALCVLLVALTSPEVAMSGTRGWLGVQIEELDDSLKEALDYKGDGILVKEVFEDSPASKSGLQAGDIITGFGGESVKSLSEFVDMVREGEPGSKVKISVVRKGKQKNIEAELGESEEKEFLGDFGKQFKGLKKLKVKTRPCLGVRIEDLSGDLGGYFDTKDGALVMSVMEDCPAGRAEMKAGDVIKEIDGTRIHDVDDVIEVLEHKKEGDEIKIKVVRKGRENELTAKLEGCKGCKGTCCRFSGDQHFFLRSHGDGHCWVSPGFGDFDIEMDLEGLEEYIDSEDFKKGIEKKVHIIGDLSEEKLKELEKSMEKLKEELKEMKKKLEKE